jgi:hypothetical protein
VVFSPALRDYVGTVLPSLGVESVRIVTYRDWAHEQRRRHFPDLPAALRPDTPASVQRLKLDPALLEALTRHVAEHPGPRSERQALDDWASVLTRPALLRECAERRTPGAYRTGAFDQFADYCRRRNEELFAWLEGDAEVEVQLDPEDDALLLRAWQLRVGPLLGRTKQPLEYRHVAIDEVQDFSPLEVQVLIDCLDERRSLTLAGDTQQHVQAHSGFTSWRASSRAGVEGDALETLRVSYRSSQEIASFAHGLLGSLRGDDEPPRATRSGPPVELFRFTDRGACVAFLADALRELARSEPLASVAVLTPSPDSERVYYEGLEKSDPAGAAARRAPGFQLRARRRGDRDRAGEGPRVRLRRARRRLGRALSRRVRGAPAPCTWARRARCTSSGSRVSARRRRCSRDSTASRRADRSRASRS